MLKKLRALSVNDIIFLTVTLMALVFFGVLILTIPLFGRLANTLGITAAIMAAGFSFLSFIEDRYERKRLNEQITVRFHNLGSDEPEDDYASPFSLRRGNCTRAELLGYIGMIPKHEKGQRFDIRWVSTRKFFNALEDIQEGSEDHIDIYCTAEEFAKFDFDAMDDLNAPDANQDTTPNEDSTPNQNTTPASPDESTD